MKGEKERKNEEREKGKKQRERDAVMKICFVMGIIEVVGSAWAIHLFSTYGTEFNGWMGMADWALLFPPIMQGLSASKLFFFVLVGLSLVYMF